MFDTAEEAFHQVAVFVHMTIIVTLFQAIAARRNHWLHAALTQVNHQGIRIVTLVGQYLSRMQALQQGLRLINVRDLTSRQQPAHRITQGIYDRMNLRAQPAARTSDRLRPRFFWVPAACWWALTTVLSSISISRSRSPLSAVSICCQRPDLPQRMKRVLRGVPVAQLTR